MNVPMQKSLILYLCLLSGALQLIANANLRNCILTGMYIYSMLLLFSPPKANNGKEGGEKLCFFCAKTVFLQEVISYSKFTRLLLILFFCFIFT